MNNPTAYDLTSVPTVAAFMADNSFLRYIQGPFGSGKSTGSVQEITRRAMMQPIQGDGVVRSRFAIVRNTYPQLRDSTIRTFLDWFPERFWGQYKVAEHEYHMRWQNPDGVIFESEVMFRALDRPDQISNLLSVEYTGAWFNEMRDIPFEIFKAMQGRVGRYPAQKDGGCSWSGVWGDSNPPDTDHWIYRVFEEEKPANAKAFYQPSGLSPEAENLPNLKPDYYQQMAIGADDDWIRVYIGGEYGFVREGKPVYQEYNDKVHCAELLYSEGSPIYRGWDFGRTPACVFAQLVNNRLFVLDELVSEGMGIETFVKQVKDFTQQNYPGCEIGGDYGDPSGTFGNEVTETTVFSVLADHGIWMEKGDQDPDVRISAVKTRLSVLVDGKPGLVVDPRAKTLRKGFIGGYAYKRLNISGERFEDKPDKRSFYSHIHDALQYLCTRLFASHGVSSGRTPRVVGLN